MELLVIALEHLVRASIDLLGRLGLIDSVSRERRELWREAARAAGLDRIEERRLDLVGWAGSFWVQLSSLGEEQTGGTALAISGPDVAGGLTVRPEDAGTSFRRTSGARELEIGDEAFDRDAWVEGNPASTRALLDADTRRVLSHLFQGRLEMQGHGRLWASGRIERGVLRIDVPGRSPAAPRFGDRSTEALPSAGEVYLDGEVKLPLVLPAALALARRLGVRGDVASRLAGNLRSEPVAGVRLRCLTTLLREFPEHPATRAALVRAREDPDAEVRVRASIALGEEGRDVLLAVAGGEGAEDATNARAVAALGSHLARAQAEGILGHALRTRRKATAGACLAALARMGGEESVRTLAKVLAVEKGEIAIAAAGALADSGEPSAEGPLVGALSGAPAEVRLAAVRALGRVGTSSAVLPLKEAEARGGALSRAAREAVARIQLRLAGDSGAAPGQLSLAAEARGQLSLAEDESERGRLALAGPAADHAPRSRKRE